MQSKRIMVAGIAAAVLSLITPGFAWLIHAWLFRYVFAFVVIYFGWSLFQRRAYTDIVREHSAHKMAFWSVVAALVFTSAFTVIWGVVGSMALMAIGIVHNREDAYRGMIFFAIGCFLLICRHYLRKNYVI